MKQPFVLPIENMTPERFEEMCRAHDLTYTYSDDHRVWKEGDMEYTLIGRAADVLGRAIAAPIWNKVVREKVSSPNNEQFLWEQ